MTGPVAAQAPADDSIALDEIVVTARKREENLIDVPLAITAVTADQIAREGIKDVQGIISRDPSLNFDSGLAPYDTRIVVRGLSPTRGRPNVATLVDGIDVSSESIGVAGGSLLINPRLIDIAQIEIVKGPQSALFGRSAFAGAISYTTLDPTDDVSGSASVDFSNRDQTEIKASISMPLTDTLGVRLNGYAFSDDGYYRNTFTGNKIGGGDGKGGSLSVKWQPNEVYSLKVRSEYSDDSLNVPAQAAMPFNATNRVPASASICNIGTAQTATGTTAAAVGFIIDAGCPVNAGTLALGLNAYRELERLTGNRGVFDDMSIPTFNGNVGDAQDQGLQVSFNPDNTRVANGLNAPEYPGSNRQVLRLSAVQNLDFGIGRFSSLTGYTRAEVGSFYDIDKTSFLAIQQNLRTESTTEQFSQELRFTSDFDGPLQFIGGLQYWTERMDQLENNLTVVGAGTTCFATQAFLATTGTQAATGTVFRLFPGGPPIIPFAPGGSCTNPTGGTTSIDVSQYMDDVDRARATSWIRRTVDHQSAYIDIEWQPIESLKLIAEARYVDEDNQVGAGFTNGSSGPGTVTLCGSAAGAPCVATVTPMSFAPVPTTRQILYPALNESYVTPKGTIQWTPTDTLNIYASYSKARKPGGYSTVTLGGAGAPASGDDIKFEAEKLNNYELGAKWRSGSGRLQVTGSAFKTDFTDKQVGTQVLVGNTITNRVTNAGAAELQGLELAAQFRPSANWLIGGGLTYFSKYEYTDYTTTSTGAGEIARVGNCTVGYLGASGAFVPLGTGPIPFIPGTTTLRSLTCLLDRSGNHIEDTPELAVALNVSYRRPVGGEGNVMFVDLDTTWQDQRFLEDDNLAYLDSYLTANLRVGLETARWSATAYVDNLGDDRTIKSAGTGPAIYAADFRLGAYNYTVSPPPSSVTPARFVFAPSIPTTTFANLPRPRTVGLRFNYKF